MLLSSIWRAPITIDPSADPSFDMVKSVSTEKVLTCFPGWMLASAKTVAGNMALHMLSGALYTVQPLCLAWLSNPPPFLTKQCKSVMWTPTWYIFLSPFILTIQVRASSWSVEPSGSIVMASGKCWRGPSCPALSSLTFSSG